MRFKLTLAALAAVSFCAQAGVIGGTHDNMGPGMGPVINHTFNPTPAVGRSDFSIISGTFAPRVNPRGAFRTICQPSHVLHDDPITNPGQPGVKHLHTFFGNTGANAHSTYESLVSSGNSTCTGGIANRTAYWVPSMIGPNGEVIWPTSANMYYKAEVPGIDPAKLIPPPNGLRMIAGDPMRKPPATILADWQFGGQAYFKCEKGTSGQAIPGELTKNVPWIPNCPAGSTLLQVINFPSCWDGVNLDSANHKSHMAYPNWTNGCPLTHPQPIATISINVSYDTGAEPLVVNGMPRWRLSADMYPDPGQNQTAYEAARQAGWANHGDWFDGWNPAVKEEWTKGCLQGAEGLGLLDCHNELTGKRDGVDSQGRTLWRRLN